MTKIARLGMAENDRNYSLDIVISPGAMHFNVITNYNQKRQSFRVAGSDLISLNTALGNAAGHTTGRRQFFYVRVARTEEESKRDVVTIILGRDDSDKLYFQIMSDFIRSVKFFVEDTSSLLPNAEAIRMRR